MALSNWLTRGEWNAVYFLGLKAAVEGAACASLGDQMRLGIAALHHAGYEFFGINAAADGSYEKVRQVCVGNERCLAELIDGTFNVRARAREAIQFAADAKIQIDLAWLSEALAALPNGRV